ncbi:penicillin-binding transpeptidase domain-containing protein [Tepidibacter hydrothermalis]|uniref:Penicillin-binding transpeptidase domain-containing protein n=1 Tax=Tepidibacter hydrothermalis TaxID=3036126 RepID=A0ABY8EES5_9FIRM|nr:penicillin-binding transpeptidase domain-containing protein [Tepidibacter hydrothermalis]WFD11453.1 penicillin-binding transpeptidase domain-containing protein [Tepidibacter hydrothermalis]
MINKKIKDRYDVLRVCFVVIFSIIILKLGYMTIIKGDYYFEQAQNKVYKKILVESPRGEIRDRYGRLLAGNRASFTVQLLKNEIEKANANEVGQKVINVLEKNGEKYIDEFPIIKENGKFVYTYDKNIEEWKIKNDIPLSYNAKESFYHIVDRLVDEGVISIDDNTTGYDLQKILNENGYYPPIYVSKWEFAENVKKNQWLYRYRIKEDEKLSTQETFNRLREYFKVDESLNDDEARKILLFRDLLKSQGYLQYQPMKLAIDIKKQTVAEIEELAIELPGVSIETEPIRYYPNGNQASHILGQIGKISQQAEIDTYTTDKGYSVSDMIGKTGIEKTFEDKLHGEKGFKKVVVDSSGRLIQNIDIQSPKAGDTVYLTIDKDLQKVAEDSLEKALKTIQAGGTFESPWGNYRLRDNKRIYNNATSGAVVALDVKTGEILAMASYPDYDPNLFATGITTEDMNKLLPKNKNNPLEAKPLYNIATMTFVQPGSIFKMITGLAAIDNGLDPKYEIYDKGRIMLGNKSFGCWIWNDYRGSHGPTNLYKAIEQSCNYYMYSISVGYDYSKEKPLPVKMNVDEILRYARLFGLDEKTGIEIEEISGKVPNPKAKFETTKRSLKYALDRKLKTYFDDINGEKDKEEYEKRVDEIVSWMGENPGRGTLLKRLEKLHIKEDKIGEVADLIKYSYFNQAKWTTGDTFNISIGQGSNAYTPIQMANYIAGLVNGGYRNKVTVVDKIESYDKMNIDKVEVQREKIPLNEDSNLDEIKKGMLRVTEQGTAKKVFGNFPVKVGAKTGTAQKSGRIPTADEVEYLISHMSSFGVNNQEALDLADKYEKADDSKYSKDYYIRKALYKLNPRLTYDEINRFKDTYDNFAWFVSFAPYDDPEIAVVSLIFQGGHGGYASPVARDIMVEYFGLTKNEDDYEVKEELKIKEELNR